MSQRNQKNKFCVVNYKKIILKGKQKKVLKKVGNKFARTLPKAIFLILIKHIIIVRG